MLHHSFVHIIIISFHNLTPSNYTLQGERGVYASRISLKYTRGSLKFFREPLNPHATMGVTVTHTLGVVLCVNVCMCMCMCMVLFSCVCVCEWVHGCGQRESKAFGGGMCSVCYS